MKKLTQKPKPIYFSDHFKVDKAKLKELGVFDPILNFDTKLFVDPILLKSSTTDIFQKSRDCYLEFFKGLLKLLRHSQHTDDRFWRAAKIKSKFSEYKYTCIGYGEDSIDGSGPGSSFSDKLLQSAKDIIETAKDDPEMFLLLPLLEDGMGADGISDMTQSIIDDEICLYTQSIMKELGLEGTVLHRSREGNEYQLLKNPFSKSVLKLLPQDILADLPLAETFDGWLVNATEINEKLRNKVNKDISSAWFEQTKAEKKESLLKALKYDDELFMEVLNVLKESTFEPYDVELDHRGLHRWLRDSEKFAHESVPKIGEADDSLQSLDSFIQSLVAHFQDLIENQGMASLFWADVRGTFKHVNEQYSQMLFFTVARTWLSAQESPVSVSYGKLVDTDQLNLRFTISGKYTVLVQVKHANNTALHQAFEKHVRYVQNEDHVCSTVIILNFRDKDSAALASIKKTRFEECRLVEIAAQIEHPKQKTETQNILSDEDIATLKADIDAFEKIEFDVPAINFEDFEWSFDENYREEKRRGGQQRHKQTTEIKEEIVKPLFLNKVLIKGKSTKQRSEKIHSDLIKIPDMSDADIELFSIKYGITTQAIKSAIPYFHEDRSEQIYKWCLAFEENGKNAQN